MSFEPEIASPPPPPAGRRLLLDASALTRCRHRVHLDNEYPQQLAGAPEDAGVRQRQEAATAKRDEVRELYLEREGHRWTVVDRTLSRAQRAAATLAACAAGAQRIWGAVLPDEPDTGRRGHAEFLVREPEGDGYFPVVVVNHKVTDPGSGALFSDLYEWDPKPDPDRKPRTQLRDQVRLAHLYRMLERHGVAAREPFGGAIGPAVDGIYVHDLSDALENYDLRLADRVAVARGERETAPSQIGECRSCPWWPQCREQLTERRDVSLVAVGSRAEVLRDIGIRTIDELAAYTGEEPESWPHGSFEDAVTTAKAWLAGVPLVRKVADVSVTRADIEVDVDMESYQERGAYLWGTLLNVDGVSAYRPFVTWDPLPTADEGRSFAEFWQWLMAERAAAAASGKTFAAYCYSRAAEDKWLLASARRFAGTPGIPTVEEVREFIDGPQWVDVYQAVSEQFVCPNGKGLKKVAPVAGFHWRDGEASGEASMGWYRLAVGYDGEPDAGQRERLLEYNEDDVVATKVLREWMTDRAAAEIPLASEL
ncbi:hypothetical protein Rrhod_4456 [Rhodococcus rhodnii LMG 5362]|uniref:YprB ribonuclease H-like domain-containing protein n=1 Tax=Rhodococcus rhodnii LMG 5362 TaxID=1273125 RepID=R7WH40_9NOCA|nr:hypothetical protein Rrhod_4456 [Rhodococcus rhodnii LMG 5362]